MSTQTRLDAPEAPIMLWAGGIKKRVFIFSDMWYVLGLVSFH